MARTLICMTTTHHGSTVRITRLFADAKGESHFGDDELEMSESVFAPPAPAVLISKPESATRSLVLVLSDGWFGKAHPAPNQQLMIMLNGTLEVTVSDGETRLFTTGNVVKVTDTIGRGHSTKSINGDAVVAVVQS